jgi:sulfate permease
MTFTYIALAVALLFAMNIGASGAAASMGVAYGSGAIPKRQLALIIGGVGVFLGAVIGGSGVIKTIGSGIVPSSIINVKIAVIILAASTISLFIANLIGIPLSTSEVTVGSIVGVGIAFQSLFIEKLTVVVAFWIIIPLIAFCITYLVGKVIIKIEHHSLNFQTKRRKRWLAGLLIITGFFEAFAAGMNNVANAVGPLVGAGMMSIAEGTLIGGLFIGLGAMLLGGKVVETNGKKITSLSLLQGSAVSGTGASLVIAASLFGLPVPLTQITTSGILGIGVAQNGFHIWQKGIIKQMLKVWIVSPIFSLVISYGFVKMFLETDFYTIIIILCVFLATVGSMSLISTAQKEKQKSTTLQNQEIRIAAKYANRFTRIK